VSVLRGLAVAMTMAPASLASWTVKPPTPPPAPLTSSHGGGIDAAAARREGMSPTPLWRFPGVFYASAANTITGPLVDQADIFPALANPSFQDHANEAIHRFIA